MKKLLIIISIFTIGNLCSQRLTTNRNPVGMEHNILFNATSRYQVSQTGTSQLNLSSLFDGRFTPSYTSNGVSTLDPLTILIEGLPNSHIQAGAWVGWSTRYWETKNFKIEGYDSYYSPNGWKTIADYSTQDYSGYDFSIKTPSGAYTKLRFTFYSSYGPDNRLGISELFFIHPEATTPYKGLFSLTSENSWSKNGNNISYNGNGNIGIGTVSPISKLEVKTISGNNLIRSISGSSNISGIDLGDIDKIDIARLRYDNSNNRLTLSTHYDNANISISPHGNGKVGIGTASPSEKLEVNGKLKTTELEVKTISGNNLIRTTSGSSNISGIDFGDVNQNDIARLRYDNSNNLLTMSTHYDNASIGIIPNGSGNVGIGMTTPSEKLDVYGNVKATEFKGNWDGANVSEVLFKGANSENWNIAVKNGIYRKKAGVNNPFGGGHSTLFNVGIHGGKNYGLQLATDNDKRLKYRGFKNNNTFNQWYDIYHSGNFNKTVLDAKVPNVTYKNVTNTFTSDQVFEGKIGIGVSNPDEKLHISSDTSGDAVLKIVSDTDNNNEGDNSRIELLQDGNLHGALIGFNLDWSNGGPSDAGNLFRIVTRSGGVNSVDNFVINPITKNVGIGTANPDSKLSVNGNIKSREVKVTVDGWSDFVFEKDYDLPTLKEVENHIKEKGHLKDIPSAAEVEKNGIFLGEINAKLLQKIEELTLYAIDQEKELQIQKQKNIELEKRLLRLEKLLNK